MKDTLKYLLLTLVMTAVSCAGQELEPLGPNGFSGKEVEVTFTLQMPGRATPAKATKSMDIDEENTINSIDVIAFKVTGTEPSESEVFSYHAIGTDITDVYSDKTNFKKFKVTLRKSGGDDYRFVLLSNLTADQRTALTQLNYPGQKGEILSKIVYGNATFWDADFGNTGNFTAIPMWGETIKMKVDDHLETTGITGVKMARMLASIDVAVTTPEAEADFELKAVHLYNYKTRGLVAPDPAKWDKLTNKALSASVPGEESGNPLTVLGPLKYETVTDPDLGFTGTIYTFEAAQPEAGKFSDATCLVVGGKYKGEDKITYYRLDHAEADGRTFIDILRNHCYKINITRVLNRGYETSIDAFNSISVDIEANIIDWSYSDVSDVVFDGQYVLNVSQGVFELSRDAYIPEDIDNKITLFTDNPAGWKIDPQKIVAENKTDVINWLKVVESDRSGNANQKKTISVLTEKNETGKDRKGYIHIDAGRLSFVVEVNQSNNARLSLRIRNSANEEITELLFPSNVGQASVPAQSFSVRWAPYLDNNPCDFVQSKLNDIYSFNFGAGDVIPDVGFLTDSRGLKTYTIQPEPFLTSEIDEATGNPFLEKINRIDYYVSDGVNVRSKSLIIRQGHYDALKETESFYLMNHESHSFNIKSNSKWKVEMVKDDDNVLLSLDPVTSTGGYDTENGQDVYFRLVDGMSGATDVFYAEVTFRITCIDEERQFESKEFTIYCLIGDEVVESNSYIIKPKARPIIIPVSKANKIIKMPVNWIGENDIIKEKFFWTDNSLGMNLNSNIRAIKAVGKGGKSFLLVAPGTAEGNAVVGITGNGEVKWSWHIWVTNYDPGFGDNAATGTDDGVYDVPGGLLYRHTTITTVPIPAYLSRYTIFMDRNLGALTTIYGDTKSQGLFYQYSRKDPFINNATWDAGGEPAIYNADGDPITHGRRGGPISISLTSGIPDTFITSSSDWLSPRYDNYWMVGGSSSDGSGKGDTDPCPPGWKLPIAQMVTGSVVSANVANGFTTTIGYIPSAGLRLNSSGDFITTLMEPDQTETFLWSVHSDGSKAGGIYIPSSATPSTALIRSGQVDRAVGAPVRCVRHELYVRP